MKIVVVVHIAVEFSVRDDGEIVHLEGTVRWFDARGLGIQFDPMGARETHTLSVLIEETHKTLAEHDAWKNFRGARHVAMKTIATSRSVKAIWNLQSRRNETGGKVVQSRPRVSSPVPAVPTTAASRQGRGEFR